MTVSKVPLAELVRDFDIYPRHEVSSQNVRKLVDAYRAGRKISPIRADRASKRIIDGFHRYEMWYRVLGAGAVVPVDLEDYADDAEMLAAAVDANCNHGLQLEEIDKRRVVLRLEALGVDETQIAKVLHVPEVRVKRLRLRVTQVAEPGGTFRKEPVKRPHFHFTGRVMTEAQAKAAESAPGVSYTLVVRWLRDAVREDLFNPDDPKLAGALEALHAELGAYIGDREGGESQAAS